MLASGYGLVFGQGGSVPPELTNVSADMGRSTNLVGVGEWSKPVTDAAGYTLRGRLLVFDTPHYTDNSGQSNTPTEWWGNAPVMLELENPTPGEAKPVGVYFALGDGFEGEMKDAAGKPATNNPQMYSFGPASPYARQSWITVPPDSAVRFRVDPSLGGFSPRRDWLTIELSMGERWTIQTNSPPFFFSGTFSPPTNHPTPPGLHLWQGLLKLPAVKLQAP
jgi:hypothetical protein